MASEYYVDENGNIVKVSGTINTADMLPIQSGSVTNTKDYIDSGLSRITALENTVSGIGSIVEGTTSGSTNCVSGGATEVGSITLDKGVYIVVAGIDWAPSGVGYRQIALATGNNPARDTAVTNSSCGASKDDYIQITAIRNITSDNTTIKVYGLQTSGSTIGAYPYIRAIKIM